jgi:hypothetical protein
MEISYGIFTKNEGTLAGYLGNKHHPPRHIKKIKWDDRNDATYGLRTSISSDLQCHP